MLFENENLFRLTSIPAGCKNYFDLDALRNWLIANLKEPNLAFPYGDCLISPYEKSEFIKQLWCTCHYSQSLHINQLDLWKDILNELCSQRKSRKVFPSLLIACPNMGATFFSWFHEFHRVMESSLNKEGFTLWIFNPEATQSIHFKKLKMQQPFPPVPFLLIGRLSEQSLDHSKTQEKREISYHQKIILHLK